MHTDRDEIERFPRRGCKARNPSKVTLGRRTDCTSDPCCDGMDEDEYEYEYDERKLRMQMEMWKRGPVRLRLCNFSIVRCPGSGLAFLA